MQQSADPRSNRTMVALLDVAERLFAERGVGAVSLREIVRDSGQRNTSAARYHFGSRAALVVAVYERRLAALNAERWRGFDRLERAGGAGDLQSVLREAVLPVADAVRRTAWGAHFVMLATELSQRPADSEETRFDPAHMTSMERFDALVLRCLPHLPAPLVLRRLQMARGYSAYALARWVRQNGPVTRSNAARFRADLDALVEFMGAGIAAAAPAAAERKGSR